MSKTTTQVTLFGILILQALTTALFAQTDNVESPSSENVSLRLTNTFLETKLAKSSNQTAVAGIPLVVPCGLGFGYGNSTCAGSSITLSVTGGGAGYYYSWNTGATTQNISDIPKQDGSSVYSVTVTNSTGTCQDIHTTAPIQIIQPTYSITDMLASNQLDCTTGNMTLQIQVSNPANVANLQYSLDGINWQSSNLFPNKSTGTYQGYVRATSNCTVSYQKFMEEFEPIEFGEIVKSNLGDCVLGNVGVSIQTTGGKVDGYRYRLNGGIWGDRPSYTGLASGSYYLEAEPINISSGSCGRYLGFTIDETNGVSLTSLQKEQETDCVLANATITALSNQPAAASVEYRLNAGTWQSSNRFTGLSSGNYTVDIRSTAGCPVAVSTLSTNVTERIYPKLQSIQVLRDRDCTTGNVELNAVLQDANIAARYRLNGGIWTTTPIFTGLSSGTFTIEVSAPDVSTCSSSLSVTVQELGQVSITSNAVYNITDCVLGNITIEAKHNALTSAGLQFRINGGAWQSSNWFKGLSAGTHTIEGRVVGDAGCIFAIPGSTVTVTEVSGLTVVDTILLSNHTDCTIGNSRIQINLKQATTAQYRLVGVSNWQSSNIFTSLSTGRYIIEVRPTNAACTERDTINFDEKTAVIGNLTITGSTDCFQGNLRVEIPVTGTPLSQPFQYRLAGFSTPSAWQNDNVFANFPGYNYNRVEVKTSSGCIFSKSADFSETESIAVSISGLSYLSGATDCIKNNTQIRINTSITVAGTGAAVNLWRINGGAWRWSPDFGSFGRDSIWVEVQATDNTRTCIIGKKLLVDEKTPLDIVSLTPSQHDDCTLNNAKIATQITGGQGAIQYKLNSGAFVSSSLFSNLSSARHLITVKDAANCQDTMSIRIAEPPLLQITSTSKANESDCPAGNAQITVNTSGVRGTLTLKANNGSPLFSNVISNLSTGTYAIVAQDAAGCTANTSVSISELAQLSLSLSKLKEEDCIPGNANIVATTAGARGAFSFRLDNGTPQTLGTFLNVPNGPHTVVAQDAAGCSASANLTIAELSPLQLPDPVVQAVNCFGESNGRISLSPTGGTAPYQYTWSNGNSTAVNQNLRAGTYTVTVTDANGCTANRSISVSEPTDIGLNLSITASPTCYGGSDGVLQSIVEGGSPAYTYAWSNGGTTAAISNLPANAYALTVTDAHGCLATASITTTQPTPVSVSYIISNDLDCIQNNVIITTNASGGRGNYSYRLDGGTLQSSGVFNDKTTGAYTLIVQDGAGCNSLPTSININEALPLSLSYSLQNDQDCIADNVTILPNATGGLGNKTFKIARYAELYFSENLSGLGSGKYTLVVEDSLKCTASQEIEIKETPVGIQALNLQGINDCVAGNTKIEVVTTGNRLPLVYRLNGQVVNGPVLNIPRIAGDYRIEVADAAGCVAFQERYIPAYDSVWVNEANLSPVSDCSIPNGGIHLVIEGNSATDYSSSVDGGATWHLGNWVGNLGPGTYTTAVRNELNGCVVQGPSVEVTAPGCFPIVGFIKDTILVTDLKQIIRLPWDIQTPPVFDKSFSLNIGLEGDGFPHLFDRPDLQNINLPELRSGNGFPRNYYYASGQQGFFYDSLFLNDSAFLYQYPESYLFKLQNAVGSEIKIDPKRDKLRVIVMLGDPDIFTEDPILICSGSCITIGEDLGPEYCYSWTEFPNESKGKIEVCPQKDAVYNLKIIRNSDFSIVKSLAYNVKVADPKIIVKADPAEICKGKETTLSWQFAPGQELLAENNWEAYWSNGMQGNSIKVSPDQTSTFTVTITSGESACGTITQDITVKVNESPGIKEILPKNPIICLSGATSSVNLVVPGQGNFSYAWSNGASTSSISVATPGTFSVSITNEKNCTTSLSTQVRNSDPQSLKQFFDGGNFFHMPVEIKTTALTPSPVLRNSDVDNRTSLGEINMRYLAYGSIFSLAGEAGSAMSGAVFGDFSSKKVYITDNTSLCLFPNTFEEIQAELKNNDLAYWIHLNKEDDNTQADYYITCSSFDKNQNAPVSAEHKGFISNRLQHVAGKIGLNGPQTLQLTMNSLIDNFVESYGDLNAQFGGTETSNPVSVDPETNCASTNKPTNVVTPAGVVFKVPEKSQIRFNIIEKYKNSAPDGALSGFTNVERDIFGGRAAPKGQTGQSINGNYFKGYENLSSRGEGYYPYTPLVDVSQPVEIWLGVAGYDPSKKIWTNTLRNQKLIDGQTNSEGSGIITKNVIGAISPPSKNLSQTYDISTAGNPPSNFAGWNVATGIKHVDRQYTDENTSHFIINIPRANGQEPISIFVDRFRRKFYVFNCANGLWTESLNINGYINDLLLTDAFYKVVDVVVKLATDGHFVLDVVGMIPVIGSAADIINGVWYYIEGDAINGTLSFVGAIPGIGELAIVGKFVAIAGTTAYVLANGKKITKFVQRIFKAGSGVDFVMDWIKYADDLRARGISDDVADSILRHLQNPAFQATDEGLALIKKFSDNPELLVNSIKTAEEAFKEGSLLTKDIDVIISISKILDDPTKLALFNRLEGGGFASFLKDYNFAGCKTCLSSTGTQLGYAAMPFLDEILENTIWAMEHFQETTGFWSLMKREADGGNLWSKDGIQHMLRDMKNQGYENVLEFEQVLAGSTKKFDVRLLGGKLVEYKSYLDPAKIDAVQLLAYFDNISGWSSLEYVFNKSKILSAGLSDLDVYKKFRTIMENNAPAMWSKNQNLLKNLFLKNGDKVKDLVDFEAYLKGLKDATEVKDFSGALFSFIKIR